MKQIIGIDPGETTGIAILTLNEDGSIAHKQTHTIQQTTPPEIAAATWLQTWLTQSTNRQITHTTVIIEDYKLRLETASLHINQPLTTAETIGALQHTTSQHPNTTTHKQQPTIKKPTTRQLHARNIPLTGNNRHEKDAELHAHYHHLRNHQ